MHQNGRFPGPLFRQVNLSLYVFLDFLPSVRSYLLFFSMSNLICYNGVMAISRYLLGGVVIGVLSVIYNYMVFWVFDFYPDLAFDLGFFELSVLNFYLVVFLKNFFVGLILMVLFSVAYQNIELDKGTGKYLAKGIFFFILYAIFAFVAFSLGDIVLMKSQEGMLVLLTVDGVIETFVATIPVKLFHTK